MKILWFVIAAMVVAGCGSGKGSIAQEIPEAPAFKLSSPAFEADGAIPEQYTCQGDDISPELSWEGAPEGTQSLALVVDDPDARGFVHWVLWNISPETTLIPEGNLPEGALTGTTGFGKTGYGGPCPPSGNHHYSFRLYALDTTLDLADGATLKDLEAAMEGHILGVAELVGTYEKN